MKVHKSHSNTAASSNMEDHGELYFNLMHEEPSGKKFDGSALPNSEI
jgi:hypothetical protein